MKLKIHDLALSHFSENPVQKRQLKSVSPIGSYLLGYKPNGFWVSIDGKEDWQHFCRLYNFQLHKLRYRSVIQLSDKPRILFLQTLQDMDEFLKKFGIDDLPKSKRKKADQWKWFSINWKKVSRYHWGIIISPYQYKRRMSTNWYYSWDVASGCIWDMRAIKSVSRIKSKKRKSR